jgi:hypothetical protein
VAPCMPATATTNRSRTCMPRCPGSEGEPPMPHDGPPGLAGRANNPSQVLPRAPNRQSRSSP